MPFKEITPLKNYIRVHDKGITISKSLLDYFNSDNGLQKVKIFIDEEKKLIGLQQSPEGYKLSLHGGGYSITCMLLSNKLEKKEYFPKWSIKQRMLIFKY